MNSKMYYHLMLMMAMSGVFMSGMPEGFNTSSDEPLTEDYIKRLKEKAGNLHKQHLLRNGCKEFQYDYRISESMFKEVTIVALNKKNADRKFDKFIKLWKESI